MLSAVEQLEWWLPNRLRARRNPPPTFLANLSKGKIPRGFAKVLKGLSELTLKDY